MLPEDWNDILYREYDYSHKRSSTNMDLALTALNRHKIQKSNDMEITKIKIKDIIAGIHDGTIELHFSQRCWDFETQRQCLADDRAYFRKGDFEKSLFCWKNDAVNTVMTSLFASNNPTQSSIAVLPSNVNTIEDCTVHNPAYITDGGHRMTMLMLFAGNHIPFTFKKGYNIDPDLEDRRCWFSSKPNDACNNDLVLCVRLRNEFLFTEITLELWKHIPLDKAIQLSYDRNHGTPNASNDELGCFLARDTPRALKLRQIVEKYSWIRSIISISEKPAYGILLRAMVNIFNESKDIKLMESNAPRFDIVERCFNVSSPVSNAQNQTLDDIMEKLDKIHDLFLASKATSCSIRANMKYLFRLLIVMIHEKRSFDVAKIPRFINKVQHNGGLCRIYKRGQDGYNAVMDELSPSSSSTSYVTQI